MRMDLFMGERSSSYPVSWAGLKVVLEVHALMEHADDENAGVSLPVKDDMQPVRIGSEALGKVVCGATDQRRLGQV